MTLCERSGINTHVSTNEKMVMGIEHYIVYGI